MMKKTITPVISVILLIMLTIAVSATAWYWVNNLQGNLEAGAGQGVDAVTGMGNIQYSIVALTCDNDSFVNVTLRNNGMNDILSTEAILIKLVDGVGAEVANLVTTVGTTLETSGTTSIGVVSINSSSSGFGAVMTEGIRYQIQTDIKGSSQAAYCVAQ